MTDFLFQMGLSNACFALAPAIVAMVVGRASKRPHLAHMLWLLVFVKLVTPPVVPIPVGISAPQPGMIASNDELPTGRLSPFAFDWTSANLRVTKRMYTSFPGSAHPFF